MLKHKSGGEFIPYVAEAGSLNGATVSGSGAVTFTANGYLPLDTEKEFKVSCNDSKESLGFKVTVNAPAPACNITALDNGPAPQTVQTDTTIPESSLFSGTSSSCQLTGCVLKHFDLGFETYDPAPGSLTGATVSGSGAVTFTANGYLPLKMEKEF